MKIPAINCRLKRLKQAENEGLSHLSVEYIYYYSIPFSSGLTLFNEVINKIQGGIIL